MSARQLRQGYGNVLLEHIKESHYPSRELMDRMEVSLNDYAQAVSYLEVLIDKVQNKYPSLELLDRIDGLLNRLESADMLAEEEERRRELEHQRDRGREREREGAA
ncbi:MAG: hypothetical protein ACRDKZ_01320 [Actinomycetota bacterium]